MKKKIDTEIENEIVIDPNTECHVITGLLKLYLRQLPKPLIPSEFFPRFKAILSIETDGKKIMAIQKTLTYLEPENYATLDYIIRFLSEVSQSSEINKMTAKNISVVFGPCFMFNPLPSFEDTDIQLEVCLILIENYNLIFSNENNNTQPSLNTQPVNVPQIVQDPDNNSSPKSFKDFHFNLDPTSQRQNFINSRSVRTRRSPRNAMAFPTNINNILSDISDNSDELKTQSSEHKETENEDPKNLAPSEQINQPQKSVPKSNVWVRVEPSILKKPEPPAFNPDHFKSAMSSIKNENVESFDEEEEEDYDNDDDHEYKNDHQNFPNDQNDEDFEEYPFTQAYYEVYENENKD